MVHSPIPRQLILLAPLLLLLGVVLAQESKTSSPQVDSEKKHPTKIVPLVSLAPGETKELLLSTHCTVGATRGGGFALAEMIQGMPKAGTREGDEGAFYSRDGVSIQLPGWDAAKKFASLPQFAALRKQGIEVFTVTVTAAKQARPGLFEMHLVDATCSGHCTTDFRVLVRAP